MLVRFGKVLAAASVFLFMTEAAYAQLDGLMNALTNKVAEKATDAISQKVSGQGGAGAGPDCKKGQMINPYYVMLQANLLPDASLADMACVSSSQLQKLHSAYAKVAIVK